MAAEKNISDFVARARDAAGANLLSVILYGSAAGGDYIPDSSDTNLLCVLADTSFAELRKLAPAAAWWTKENNRTPLLMGATQFINQKMTPTAGDPSTARMMLIMPVVMTIFFMNFQSGLVLYWLTNNVLQIGQQYIINRLMAKKKRETHGQRKK